LLAALEKFGAAVPNLVVEIPEGLEELVPAYLSARQQDLADFRLHAEAGKFDQIRFLAHNMKGTGTSYGFPRITEIGAAMESSAEAADQAAVSVQIADLANYLARVSPIAETSDRRRLEGS
jgi:HPt (histidine-containing phosphotransfer) domain-containing protein